MCRGGWPYSLGKSQNKFKTTLNHYKSLFNFRSSENPAFKNKNPEIMEMVLKSYSRNISTEAKQKPGFLILVLTKIEQYIEKLLILMLTC